MINIPKNYIAISKDTLELLMGLCIRGGIEYCMYESERKKHESFEEFKNRYIKDLIDAAMLY